jgi:CRISPR-associated endonuclease Cas3-HD
MEKIYSHPPKERNQGTELYDHSTDVADRVENILSTEQEFGHKIGLMHDIGKATSYFQQKIGVQDGNPSETYTRHSLIGGIVSYLTFMDRDSDEKKAVLSLMVIGSHHSDARNLAEKIESYEDMGQKMFDRLKDQYLDIVKDEDSRSVINRLLPDQYNIQDDLYSNVLENKSTLTKVFTRCRNYIWENTPQNIEDIDSQSHRIYQRYLMLYGALVFADKTSVAGLRDEDIFREPRFQAEKIDQYIESELSPPKQDIDEYSDAKTKMNALREKARNEAIDNLDTDETRGNLYTIHLPTGFGKTLTSLSVANRLMGKRKKSSIVYALPLTTIIDQTVDTIRKVYSEEGDKIEPSKSPHLTVHHHLSDTTTDIDRLESERDISNIEGYKPDQLYSETWLSDITVTTFVQLFGTLVGPRNGQSMKLGAMHNKVIIVDEIQSLPTRWWGIITSLLRTLVEEYNCDIVSITATHPEIYERDFCDLEPISLVDPKEYYDFLDENQRINFSCHESAESFIYDGNGTTLDTEELSRIISNSSSDSTAAVLNTISDAKNTYRNIKKNIPDSVSLNSFVRDNLGRLIDGSSDREEIFDELRDEIIISNITTRIRPLDRRLIIEGMKYLLDEDQELYVTATQVFEAGVDISFHKIYRDVCPASSIVQTAGRCNRNFGGDIGKIEIVRIGSGAGKSSAESVYRESPKMLRHLDDLGILDRGSTEKTVVYDGIERYFNSIFETEGIDGFVYGDSELLIEYYKGKGDKLVSESVIESAESYDIIVPPTKNIACQLNNDIDSMDPYAVLHKYQDYTISVPSYSLNEESATVLTETLKLEDAYRTDVDETIWFCGTSNPDFYNELGIETKSTSSNSSSHIGL